LSELNSGIVKPDSQAAINERQLAQTVEDPMSNPVINGITKISLGVLCDAALANKTFNDAYTPKAGSEADINARQLIQTIKDPMSNPILQTVDYGNKAFNNAFSPKPGSEADINGRQISQTIKDPMSNPVIKAIADVSLGVLSGSSYANKSFNDAYTPKPESQADINRKQLKETGAKIAEAYRIKPGSEGDIVNKQIDQTIKKPMSNPVISGTLATALGILGGSAYANKTFNDAFTPKPNSQADINKKQLGETAATIAEAYRIKPGSQADMDIKAFENSDIPRSLKYLSNPVNALNTAGQVLDAGNKFERDSGVNFNNIVDVGSMGITKVLSPLTSNSRFEQKHMRETVKFFNIS
jgi:hypothetical protein